MDYSRFRQIADSVGAYLLTDMSHVSGLVAAQELNDPFPYSDIVTTTTHKSLRGARSGMIFYNKGRHAQFEETVPFAVFPQIQGGPHNHQIAGVATQLKQVMTPEFKAYIKQVKSNAKALSESMIKKGHSLISGGTSNHLMLWDVRPFELTGSKMDKVCDLVHITLNKNTVIGDKS